MSMSSRQTIYCTRGQHESDRAGSDGDRSPKGCFGSAAIYHVGWWAGSRHGLAGLVLKSRPLDGAGTRDSSHRGGDRFRDPLSGKRFRTASSRRFLKIATPFPSSSPVFPFNQGMSGLRNAEL